MAGSRTTASKIFDPFGWNSYVMNPNQNPNEWDLTYGARKLLAAPTNLVFGEAAAAADTVGEAFGTPNKRMAQQQNMGRSVTTKLPPARDVFPNSYNDPAYDQAEAYASKLTGVPQELLRTIRTRGERSNNNQVSSAGARSPYQITPETAGGIKKNYSIDPFASPENAALSAAYVLREQANLVQGRKTSDPVDWSDPRNRMAAARGYHGGQDQSNWGPVNQDYAMRTLGPNTGLPAPFVSPFDPTYHNRALGEINAAQSAALKPETVFMDRPDAPEMPAPIIPAKADFSQADKWLADLKPVEMMATEKRQIEREGWFKGLAQAASSISGGEGIGTMFLRLGAGSLGGAMAGKDEVRQRMDKFDQKMSQWQLLNFQNEGQKAQIVAGEARQEAALLNGHAMDKFKVAYEQWSKDNAVTVQGDAVISSRVGPDGQLAITRTPLQGPIMSAFALHRAQTLSALGGLNNNANSMVASATNGLLANEAATMYAHSLSRGGDSVSGQEAQDALITSQATAATNVVKYGRLADVIPGEDDQKGLFKEVDTAMQALGMMPGSEGYSERREMMIAERLLRIGITNRELMERIQNAGGAGLVMSAAERFNSRTERRSVDSKGRPTSSVSYRNEE